MKKSEIKVGQVYRAKVNGKVVPCRVDSIREVNCYVGAASSGKTAIQTRYDVTNLTTGRKTTFRSAMKFRELVQENPATAGKVKPQEITAYAANQDVDGKDTTDAPEVEQRPPFVSTPNNATPASTVQIPDSRMKATDALVVEQLKSPQSVTSAPVATLTANAPCANESPLASILRRSIASVEAGKAPHVIVEARAGSGKTTTLVEGLKALKGLPTSIEPSPQQRAVWDQILLSRGAKSVGFCAFNKSIAQELQARVPAGCDSMTMHSLGYRAVTRAFGRVQASEWAVKDIIAEVTRVDLKVLRKDKFVMLNATERLVSLCKQNLVAVASEEELERLSSHYDVDLDRHKVEVFRLVPQVLDRCRDPKGKISFDDMIWLPIVHDLPLFCYDLLLIDEAQDLNRCQQALAKKAGHRLILVGDPHQCQPPGTMVTKAGKPGNRWQEAVPGERVPIESLKEGDMLMGYCPKDAHTYSNRIVQGIAANQFSGELVLLTTEEGVKTRYTPEHKCYASFGALRDCYCVYLMCRNNQFRVGSCQINYKASGNGIVHRLRTEGGDAAWMLEVHPTKREARLREMELSHEYRLPQIVFKNANDGYILDDEGVVRFWDFVGDNSKEGRQALKHFKLEWNCPIAVPGEQWQQSFKRPCIFAACNLVDGMEVRTEEGRWVRIKVQREKYVGPVYSLSVSHDELYMADGIVTHNSIYGFAGADSESMSRMERELSGWIGNGNDGRCVLVPKDPQCVVLPLTVTRRCGKAIVEEARKIVPDFEAHESNPEGVINEARYPGKYRDQPEVKWEDSYGPQVRDGDMVLCRTNAPLVSQCFAFIRRGRKANIQGRDVGRGLLSTLDKMKAESVTDLIHKLSEWAAQEITKEQAKKFASENRVNGIQDRLDCLLCFTEGAKTVDEVKAKIESVFTDDKRSPGVKLSSIHRAKGLEAQRVFILRPPGTGPRQDKMQSWELEQEANLRYVSVTRAISKLVYVS